MTERRFPVDPWQLHETSLDLELLAQTESLFALSNGHIGLRGNLDEGEPHGLPGTYLNSFYELRPLPYAEAGYGYPESGQTLINVTNGKLIRLLVDDEPFDVRYGELLRHERILDFRTGTLFRQVEWNSPAGCGVRVTSTRLVSLVQRSIAAIAYEVEPLGDSVRVVVQSELVANEELPAQSKDPRVAAVLEAPLVSDEHHAGSTGGLLIHQTRRSGLRMAALMDHTVDGPANTETLAESLPDLARTTVVSTLQPGQRLRIVKFLAYGWSSQRSLPALRAQAAAALTAARHTGWDGLAEGQRATLDDFWDRADVELKGDPEVQQSVRLALFHVLQAGLRAEGRAIAAKGLTGPGYDGHAFWDTEIFVLPVFTFTTPQVAADALRWRHATMPLAEERAQQLGLQGAAFPWRTIRGQECSSYWPAGTAAFHINADIANAVVRYVRATGDEGFQRGVGMELLVATARLFCSLGHFDAESRFCIDGVTGPDEYSAIADNNVYTNLMAQQNLTAAADLAERYPDRAEALQIRQEESATWRAAAAAMAVPYNIKLGVHEQAERFTEHQEWDFANTPPDNYPLLLHYPYFDLYRKQVVKQPDLVLAMQLRGESFTEDEKVRNFAYYERLTVRDSSLSAGTHSVIAAELGHLDLAYDYLGEAAFMDLDDLNHNTRDGLHLASLAAAWTAIVGGLGGMREHGGRLSFAPRLPDGISRLVFKVLWRDRHVRVEVDRDKAWYTVTGEPLELWHHGKPIEVSSEPVAHPIPPAPSRPRPSQPPGREPRPRRLAHRPPIGP
jgi:alpha,alpha-trehalose phosphorylase